MVSHCKEYSTLRKDPTRPTMAGAIGRAVFREQREVHKQMQHVRLHSTTSPHPRTTTMRGTGACWGRGSRVGQPTRELATLTLDTFLLEPTWAPELSHVLAEPAVATVTLTQAPLTLSCTAQHSTHTQCNMCLGTPTKLSSTPLWHTPIYKHIGLSFCMNTIDVHKCLIFYNSRVD